MGEDLRPPGKWGNWTCEKWVSCPMLVLFLSHFGPIFFNVPPQPSTTHIPHFVSGAIAANTKGAETIDGHDNCAPRSKGFAVSDVCCMSRLLVSPPLTRPATGQQGGTWAHAHVPLLQHTCLCVFVYLFVAAFPLPNWLHLVLHRACRRRCLVCSLQCFRTPLGSN